MIKINFIILAILFVVFTSRGQSNLSERLQYKFHRIDSVISVNWKNEITRNKELPYPYITAFSNDPCMFYWDTYFINKGLIACNNLKLAKQNTLNILSVVDRFGYMGNASVTTWGMNRSQPPYLSEMVRDIYLAEKDKQFLRYAYPILKQEYLFWTSVGVNVIEDHSTSINGLQRYSHHATKAELRDLYDGIAERICLRKDISNDQKSIIGSNYATEAESGMDFTSRFDSQCAEYIAVDLNSLIYNMENNLQWMKITLQLSDQPDWAKRAKKRKRLLDQYCWDDKVGMYFDFNFVTGKKSRHAAVTTFQPLWAGMASKNQAKRVLNNIQIFDTQYGLTTLDKTDPDEKYQWGSSSIWAPMQLIVVDGLRNYGFDKKATEISQNFLILVAKNYFSPTGKNKVSENRKPGFLYEKYRSDGIVSDIEAPARNMMGWTAGVYSYLYQFLYGR